MAAAEVDMAASEDERGPEQEQTPGIATEREDESSSGVGSGGKTAESQNHSVSTTETLPEGSPVKEENKKPVPVPIDNATTYLPSPLPSPRDELATLATTSTYSRSPPRPILINTGGNGVGLNLSTDLPSCAVSETDTDAPTSAIESSTDGFPLPSDAQDPPKKPPGRTPSTARRTRDRSGTKSSDHGSVRRLSASKIQELTASPDSLPIAPVREQPLSAGIAEATMRASMATQLSSTNVHPQRPFEKIETSRLEAFGDTPLGRTLHSERPSISSRTLSTPAQYRQSSNQPLGPSLPSRRDTFQHISRSVPTSNPEAKSTFGPAEAPKSHLPDPSQPHEAREFHEPRGPRAPSPIPLSFPIPPLSAPTFLQLELAAQRPSPLYVYHTSDIPYESSAVKFERLKNFLLLPPYLERTLVIGALACLDAWLWTLTILPIRFCLAVRVLVGWWAYVLAKEARWLVGFVWEGLGRMWRRGRMGRGSSRRPSIDSRRSSEAFSRSSSAAREPLREFGANGSSTTGHGDPNGVSMRRTPSERTKTRPNGFSLPALNTSSRPRTGPFHHKRTKSVPSNLSSFHKADLLQFAVIMVSSLILTQLDASRMYHFIRAQSAVKLYVIYNLVEVGDRLLSALGQDIFECLFSSEVLSRNSLGRSKVVLPFGMFCLALAYNCAHAITLFYQVITLNVAVNSYSNALLTLLMSNQFVEIKGSVFKRFEKENTFQLTCADVVERFQLWIVLLIIGMRNVVEVGGLSVPGAGIDLGEDMAAKVPLHNPSILPMSFTILPSWLWSGEVLSPFLVVIGSEMLVDWIKHAYINKFNNIKPKFYSRVLDILCKDYYTNAFVAPTLTRRLGLPLLPLSTLFIRASFQTYHMFLATHMPAPLPPSTQTSLSVESTPTSPAVTAALDRLDHLIRNALGRSVYGLEGDAVNATAAGRGKFSWFSWNTDDAIAVTTLIMVVFVVWLVLLIVKLFLGMFLLRYSRDRYARMKLKEHAVATGKAEKESFDAKGKRIGGFGAVEIGDDRRRWVYGDDSEGLKKARERERKTEEKRDKGGDGDRDLNGVMRYEMVAKRIW